MTTPSLISKQDQKIKDFMNTDSSKKVVNKAIKKIIKAIKKIC